MTTEELNKPVYMIEDGQIEEVDLRHMITEYGRDCTTTPDGVAPCEFVTHNKETGKFELWSWFVTHNKETGKFELWSWGFSGNNPYLLSTHDTEYEADMALYDCWKYNLERNDNAPAYCFDRDEAEKFIA